MSESEPIAILAPKNFRRDDHLAAFYELLGNEGFRVLEFSLTRLWRQGRGIWHIHWINPYIRGTITGWGITKPLRLISLLRAGYFLSILAAAKWRGINIVWSVHNVEMHTDVSTGIERFVTQRLLSAANRVTAYNEYIKSELIARYGYDKVRILRQGGYQGRFPPVPPRDAARRRQGIGEEEFVLLFLGNVMHYKGVDILIEAFLKADLPDARLIIAGSSANEPDYGEHIASLCAKSDSKRIVYMNHFINRDLVPELFACVDYAIYPYRKISNSGVLFLAVEMATPVIIANKGGVPEVFDCYGALGHLIKDVSVAGVTEAIQAAYHDTTDFSHNLARARDELDWEKNKKEIVDCFLFDSGS